MARDRSHQQAQEARDNANQVQVAGDLVVVTGGVTETRAAEIAREQAREVIAAYSTEAASVARQRIDRFDEVAVATLTSRNLLHALSEPSFQMLLRKAQAAAAANGEETTLDLLAELIAARAADSVPRIRATSDRAISVVEMLDDDALHALTVIGLALIAEPLDGLYIGANLAALDAMFEKALLVRRTPTQSQWRDILDHLEVLGLVRLQTPAGRTDSLAQIWERRFPGWSTDGFAESHIPAVTNLRLYPSDEVVLEMPVIDHELLENRWRVAFATEAHLRKFLLGAWSDLPEYKIAEVKRVLSFYPGANEAIQANLQEYDSLTRLSAWFRSLPANTEITVVGRMITLANLKRVGVEWEFQPLSQAGPPGFVPAEEFVKSFVVHGEQSAP